MRPRCRPVEGAAFAELIGSDGYRATMSLADLLQPHVLLADHLNGAPLSCHHGEPLRLVAPAHYADKSVKHLTRLELHSTFPRSSSYVLDHPRGRVAFEERARLVPGPAVRTFAAGVVRPALWWYRVADPCARR